MNPISRFFNWLKALFNRGMDKLEDPEIMLDQARRDMQQMLSKNRESAIQAITQRNKLQQMYDDQVNRSSTLEKQAEMALKQGNRDLARTLIREKQTIDGGLEGLKASLAQATETVDQVKVAISRQQEDIRRKASESLALKAQWQQAKVQSSITKALEGLTFENEFESSFAAAREKVKTAMAESSARQEMYGTSVEGKVMAMQDMAMDSNADDELKKLEERLGLAQPAPQTTTTANTGLESAEAELAELEKRLTQGQGGDGKPA